MSTKADLHPYLTSVELKSLYLCTTDRVESVEKHLLWLVSLNWTIQQASKAVGAGNNKIILLVIDRAGWQMSENVVVPEGIYLEPLPPYSPELQPAERLWQLYDEPLANKSFDTLSGVGRSISRTLLHSFTNAISGTSTYQLSLVA